MLEWGEDDAPALIQLGRFISGDVLFQLKPVLHPADHSTHQDAVDHSFSGSRFHGKEPIFFQHGLRLTRRCEEFVGGWVVGDPQDKTYTSQVWVYE